MATEIIILSDTHIGKKTETFDTSIALSKIERLKKEIDASRARFESLGGSIEESVVAFLGDMVDGELIYPAHQLDLEMDVNRQIVEAADILEEFILWVQPSRVYAVSGNHGRSSRHGRGNWDYVMYEILKSRTGEVVKHFSATPESYIDASVGGLGVRFWHPYNVRMYMQLPWYGLIREGMKARSIYGVDVFFVGHFHRFFYVPGYGFDVYGNGALMEGGEYMRTLGFECDSRFWHVFVERGKVVYSSVLDAGCNNGDL